MENYRRNLRESPNDYVLVYDHNKNEFIGRLLNLSHGGMMLLSEGPIETPQVYNCRLKLPEMIYGHDHIIFDAESIWCRINQNTKMYETGYEMKNVDDETKKMVGILVKIWNAVNSDNNQTSWQTKYR